MPIGLNPQLAAVAAYVQEQVRRAGGQLVVTSAVRSTADQARLYAQRASNPNPVARPGTSLHERGLAVDMVVTPREWQTSVGLFWEQLGGVWGGRFSQADPVHFQVPASMK